MTLSEGITLLSRNVHKEVTGNYVTILCSKARVIGTITIFTQIVKMKLNPLWFLGIAPSCPSYYL